MTTNPKCTNCKRYFEPKLKSSGLVYKTCESCRINTRKSNNNTKCQHNRREFECRDCNGLRFCEHNRFKSRCKECGNVIKIIIQTFIDCSKTSDKKYNRFDIVNFIDKDFCKLLIEESNNKCCYCECELELIKHSSNLMSIERIDNTLGHIKSNVKIACLSCNLKRSRK